MELTGKEISLRAFRDSDAQKIARLCNNKKIWDNLRDSMPYPYNLKDAEVFIENCNKEKMQVTFAIQYKDEFAGVIGLVPQSDIYKLSAEMGYWIGEPYWGLGIATKAVKLVLDYGFIQLKLARIYSGIFDYNIPSQRVLEKAGFKKEAVFEKAVYKNGAIFDEIRYASINPKLTF